MNTSNEELFSGMVTLAGLKAGDEILQSENPSQKLCNAIYSSVKTKDRESYYRFIDYTQSWFEGVVADVPDKELTELISVVDDLKEALKYNILLKKHLFQD